MRCTSCLVYDGTPVCGACKAARRISAIVGGGHLPLAREGVVLSILRNCAGALSDLAEEEDKSTKGAAGERPVSDRGNKSPSPGAKKPRKAEAAVEEHLSEYTYESETEEPQEGKAEEEVNWDRDSPSPEPTRAPRRSADSGKKEKSSGSGAKPSSRGKVVGGVDPHYLTKALQHKSLPRWSAAYKRASQDEAEVEEIVEEELPPSHGRHHGHRDEEAWWRWLSQA